MFHKNFCFVLCILALTLSSRAEAGRSSTDQAVKYNPLEREILRAKTKADFERILLNLSLINPFDRFRGKTIDAAMKIPQSKRLLVFYCVCKSSREPNNNDVS